MIELPNLKEMTAEAKDALILSLWEELQTLRQASAKKKKTTGLPPSQGFRPQTQDRGGKVTRKGAGDR
jgi:transposase